MPADPPSNSTDSPPQPTGFARVAKQITSRTTDLLGIAIVVIGGLAVGGQLTEWWSTDPTETPSTAELTESVIGSQANWVTSKSPVSLEFGESPYTLRRQEIRGNEDQAVAALIANCRQALQSATNKDRTTDAPSPNDANQRRLLARLAALKPVEEQLGKWQIYRLDHPLTMLIGVHAAADERAGESNDGAAKHPPVSSASDQRRLLCWGLAFPFESDRWKLFSFRDARQTSSSPGSLPNIELPAGSRRVLSIRSEDGGAIVVFEGDANPNSWMRFFSNWFETHQWQASQPWSASRDGWSARYSTKKQSSRIAADLQLHIDDGGKLNGLMNLSRSN